MHMYPTNFDTLNHVSNFSKPSERTRPARGGFECSSVNSRTCAQTPVYFSVNSRRTRVQFSATVFPHRSPTLLVTIQTLYIHTVDSRLDVSLAKSSRGDHIQHRCELHPHLTVWRRHTPFDSQTVRSDGVGVARQCCLLNCVYIACVYNASRMRL
eukprot:sb/3473199/